VNHPEESIQLSEHGESFEIKKNYNTSRTTLIYDPDILSDTNARRSTNGMTHALNRNATEPVWYVHTNEICLFVNGSCGSRFFLELV
jgi:hypothetical protein